MREWRRGAGSPCSQARPLPLSTRRTFGAATDSQKRSINLALSHRTQCALRQLGLEDAVMAGVVPMRCRAMHAEDGSLFTQPYGTPEQAIFSVPRTGLNEVLLDAAEAEGVVFSFDTALLRVTADPAAVVSRGGATEELAAKAVFGADGAYSRVRASMMRMQNMDFNQHYIKHGYKELTIEPGPSGEWPLPTHEALHIWPRPDFMLIALPNADKSFTCTLFAPFETFAELDAVPPAELVAWFERQFGDAVPLLGDIPAQWSANPTSSLVTMRVKPWNVGSKVCLIGDAAHAVVPFYGQGMNCAAEDALSFDEMLGKCGGDLGKAIPAWAAERQPAGDGLADLSYANYAEMRSHTADPGFLLQKRVEGWLHAVLPETWIPQYTMVAFTRIPYHEAKARAEAQDATIGTVVASLKALGAAVLLGGLGWAAAQTEQGAAALRRVKGAVGGALSSAGQALAGSPSAARS